jgi:hypothetical protein
MKSSRMRVVIACCVLLSVGLLLHPAGAYSADITSTIRIAPNVLNIQSEGTVVTVHTDIRYYVVDVYTVYLNGIAISSWKADNRGNFVAKFSMDEVKLLDGLVIGDYNTLQIVGLTLDGETFVGEQDIKVIDVIPEGR